jgi:hypothetical protein
MKKYLILLAAIVFCACSKMAGDPVTRSFDISNNYITLDVDDAFDVYVSDAVDKVVVTLGEKLMDKLVVEEVNNTLKIYLKPFTILRSAKNTVLIPYNARLREVGLSGAASFHTEFPLVADYVNVVLTGSSHFFGDIVAEEIDMDLSGSSDVKGKVSATEMDLDLSGSSDATLEGVVGTLKIDLSGASDIEKKVVGSQYALSCLLCKGSMSGASDAHIHSDGEIRVKLSGASELRYTGNASTIDSTVSGGSEIIHDGLK